MSAGGGGAAPGEPVAGEPLVGGPVVGDDGRARCPWGDAPEVYRRYHDEEWGRPVTGESALFERLSLEAFQSGLSWLVVLRKRPAFRAAFAGFDADAVAAFGPRERERLLADAGIVRNRAKVDAVLANARAVVALRGRGGLEALLARAAEPPGARPAPRTVDEVPSATPASTALARSLKAAGLVFVGPTTAYATMQAAGLVDDHLAGCWVRGAPGVSAVG